MKVPLRASDMEKGAREGVVFFEAMGGGSTRQYPRLRRPNALVCFDFGDLPAGALRGAERGVESNGSREGVKVLELADLPLTVLRSRLGFRVRRAGVHASDCCFLVRLAGDPAERGSIFSVSELSEKSIRRFKEVAANPINIRPSKLNWPHSHNKYVFQWKATTYHSADFSHC